MEHHQPSTMSQPWYGQNGPAPGASNISHGAVGSMNNHRYQSAAGGMAAGNPSVYSAHRSSPSVTRPPSSASTSSNISLSHMSVPSMMGQGPAPASSHPNQGHPVAIANGQQTPMQHHMQGHHGGMNHHVPTPRYPMPGHNGNVHSTHVGPRGQIHGRNHHGAPGMVGGPALRQLPNGNPQAQPQDHPMAPHSGHAQYGAAAPAASNGMIPQGGHTSIHHPVPYRHHPRLHTMAGPQNAPPSHHYQHHHQHATYHRQGYQHNVRQSNYHAMPNHHPSMGPHRQHEAKYNHYQRPAYESPQTVVENSSVSQSPSPPPPPPSAPSAKQAKSSEENSSARTTPGASPMPLRDRLVSDESKISTSGSNIQLKEGSASENTKPEPPTKEPSKTPVTEDDDAASILLQLSGIPSQASVQDAGSRPASTIQTSGSGTLGSHPLGNYLKPIEPSSSIDDEVTVTTTEGTDCAPDLTSEPSSDSIEQTVSEFPAPIPENYPTRLALPYDDTKLNSLHCFLRSELLEIFVVQKSSLKSPTHSPGSSVGRVGLRCVHCAMLRKHRGDRDEAPMAVFYPKSIAEIYRLVTSWQRCHLRKCKSLPPAVRAKWQCLRENDKSRGKTHYWITSAKEIGLVDCQSRAGGIRFGPNTRCTPATPKEQEQTPCAVSSTDTENNTVPAIGVSVLKNQNSITNPSAEVA